MVSSGLIQKATLSIYIGDKMKTHDINFTGVPGFRVTTSGQTVGATSWEIIEFDTEEYDERGEWDTVNFKFTATQSGTYLFCLRASLLNMDSQKAIGLRIRKKWNNCCICRP